MDVQSLVGLAWAFVTVNFQEADEKLLSALATSAERKVSEFDGQNLAKTAWVFATVNWSLEGNRALVRKPL